jgi:hypothetical protein
MIESILQSFFVGGFEGSTHRRLGDAKRLDMIAATQHDRFAFEDYARLRSVGICTARDSIRWYLAERPDGRYDWESVLPMLRAARETDVQIIWDLLHFGWPDHIDPFTPAFVDRFARFARAFTRLLVEEGEAVPFIAPINEPSFLAFASAEKGFFDPFAKERGDEIKSQFVRAIIAACEAVWEVSPKARIVHTDPIINIIADPRRPQDRLAAEQYRQAQFSMWDMIAGLERPELGGQIKYLDILGLDYYIHNQWVHNDGLLVPSHPHHLPLRYMLREVYERYARPLLIAETSIEASVRADWLRYVGHEARAALRMKIPVEAICLYPIVDHPGWDDERHCSNGLWGYADERGEREPYQPLVDELKRQQRLLLEMRWMPDQEYVSGPESDVEIYQTMDWNILNAAAHTMNEVTARSRGETANQ